MGSAVPTAHKQQLGVNSKTTGKVLRDAGCRPTGMIVDSALIPEVEEGTTEKVCCWTSFGKGLGEEE